MFRFLVILLFKWAVMGFKFPNVAQWFQTLIVVKILVDGLGTNVTNTQVLGKRT